MPGKTPSKKSPHSKSCENVISLASKIAEKKIEANQVQRYLDYVSLSELQLLTPIRMNNPAVALQWISAKYGVDCIVEFYEKNLPSLSFECKTNSAAINGVNHV